MIISYYACFVNFVSCNFEKYFSKIKRPSEDSLVVDFVVNGLNLSYFSLP